MCKKKLNQKKIELGVAAVSILCRRHRRPLLAWCRRRLRVRPLWCHCRWCVLGVVCCSCWSSRAACCSFHFDLKIGFKIGSGQPKTTQSHFGKIFKKKVSSVIIATPPPPLSLWRPPWRRHLKPATPPLFGGVFSKIRAAIPPWRRHLTTLPLAMIALWSIKFFSSLFPSSFRFYAARAEPSASKTRAGLFNMTLCHASSLLFLRKLHEL